MPVQTSKNGNIVTWTATVISNGVEDITEDYDDWIVEAQRLWILAGLPDNRSDAEG